MWWMSRRFVGTRFITSPWSVAAYLRVVCADRQASGSGGPSSVDHGTERMEDRPSLTPTESVSVSRPGGTPHCCDTHPTRGGTREECPAGARTCVHGDRSNAHGCATRSGRSASKCREAEESRWWTFRRRRVRRVRCGARKRGCTGISAVCSSRRSAVPGFGRRALFMSGDTPEAFRASVPRPHGGRGEPRYREILRRLNLDGP